jgi:ribosome-binding protein aMBF1 (putative translation factor)
MYFMAKLTEFIKRQREAKAVSQGMLAKHLGLVNGQFISNIENGRNQYPPIYFNKIKRLLKLDMLDLKYRAIEDYQEWLDKEIAKGE